MHGVKRERGGTSKVSRTPTCRASFSSCVFLRPSTLIVFIVFIYLALHVFLAGIRVALPG